MTIPQSSPALLALYLDYAAWLGRGAPHGRPYLRGDSLCDSVQTLAMHRLPIGMDGEQELLDELRAQLEAAGLDPTLPFETPPEHGARRWSNTAHECPERIEWVAARIRQAIAALPAATLSTDKDAPTMNNRPAIIHPKRRRMLRNLTFATITSAALGATSSIFIIGTGQLIEAATGFSLQGGPAVIALIMAVVTFLATLLALVVNSDTQGS